jgi:hypothetical protein
MQLFFSQEQHLTCVTAWYRSFVVQLVGYHVTKHSMFLLNANTDHSIYINRGVDRFFGAQGEYLQWPPLTEITNLKK